MSVIIHNSVNEMMLSNETVPAVYKKTVTALKDTGIDLIKELPSFNQIKSSIYRRRNKLNKVKKMSYLNETVNAVEIPAPFKIHVGRLQRRVRGRPYFDFLQ